MPCALLILGVVVSHGAAAQTCPSDCDGDGTVGVNELIRCVNIALGNAQLNSCPACDTNADARVMVNELVQGVSVALTGCGPLSTPTPVSRTPVRWGSFRWGQGKWGE